jgi:hypothetical protein
MHTTLKKRLCSKVSAMRRNEAPQARWATAARSGTLRCGTRSAQLSGADLAPRRPTYSVRRPAGLAWRLRAAAGASDGQPQTPAGTAASTNGPQQPSTSVSEPLPALLAAVPPPARNAQGSGAAGPSPSDAGPTPSSSVGAAAPDASSLAGRLLAAPWINRFLGFLASLWTAVKQFPARVAQQRLKVLREAAETDTKASSLPRKAAPLMLHSGYQP